MEITYKSVAYMLLILLYIYILIYRTQGNLPAHIGTNTGFPLQQQPALPIDTPDNPAQTLITQQ